MKAMSLDTIAEYCGGQLVHGDGSVQGQRVNTDSRKIQAGDVFVALVGERFDAHHFLLQVAEAGAAAVIVSRLPDNLEQFPCPVIVVGDTLIALQNLALAYRRHLGVKIIGITGSNGKTSTKDMVLAVLRSRFSAYATAGNLNNHIGVPLTLLSMDDSHEFGVVEMGMNHFGEIAVLAKIAEPDAAIITNVGVAHIEYMGSRAGIAKEKGTLAEAIGVRGAVVLNANDDYSDEIAARSKGRVILAGVEKGDVSAKRLKFENHGTEFVLNFASKEEASVTLPVLGEHMVGNAALAAACGWHFGVTPEECATALSGMELTKGRLQAKTIDGIFFLDDSYNANPDSMKAGLKTLAATHTSGRRIAVLGRMGELGSHAESSHRSVGEYAATLPVDAIFTVGSSEAEWITDAAGQARGEFLHQHFATHADCAAYLRRWLEKGDAVLLKGSRSSAMEQVLTHFESA